MSAGREGAGWPVGPEGRDRTNGRKLHGEISSQLEEARLPVRTGQPWPAYAVDRGAELPVTRGVRAEAGGSRGGEAAEGASTLKAPLRLWAVLYASCAALPLARPSGAHGRHLSHDRHRGECERRVLDTFGSKLGLEAGGKGCCMRLTSRGLVKTTSPFWGGSLVQGLSAWSLCPFCAQVSHSGLLGSGRTEIGDGSGLVLKFSPLSLASTSKTRGCKEKDGKKEERREPGFQFHLCQ